MYNIDEDFSLVTEPRPWMDIPEQRLLFAVLERAVRDYLGNQPAEIAASAEWLFDDCDGLNIQPFSFEWVCDQLGLESGQFLATVRETALRSKAPRATRLDEGVGAYREHGGCQSCIGVAA